MNPEFPLELAGVLVDITRDAVTLQLESESGGGSNNVSYVPSPHCSHRTQADNPVDRPGFCRSAREVRMFSTKGPCRYDGFAGHGRQESI